MYFIARRISAATSSGRSACNVRWLTAPMATFFLRSFRNGANNSMSLKFRSFISTVQMSPLHRSR